MTETVQVAAFLVSAGAIGWLASLFVGHLRECRQVQKDNATSIATIIATLQRIENEIGDHETGLRGRLHDHQTEILKLNGRLSMFMRDGER